VRKQTGLRLKRAPASTLLLKWFKEELVAVRNHIDMTIATTDRPAVANPESWGSVIDGTVWTSALKVGDTLRRCLMTSEERAAIAADLMAFMAKEVPRFEKLVKRGARKDIRVIFNRFALVKIAGDVGRS